MKKNRLFVCIGIVIMIAISSFGYSKYSEAQKQKAYELKIAKELKQLKTYDEAFAAEEDAHKLSLLEDLQLSFKAYQSGKEKDKSVIEKYQTSIEQFQRYFIDKNSHNVADAEIEDVEEEKKERLTQSIQSLKIIATTVQA